MKINPHSASRLPLLFVLATAAALTGCGSDGRDVSRSGFEADGKTWPLTVDEATLSCDGMAVFAEVDGKRYAVNGTAKARAAILNPIWADDPNMPGLKIDMSDLIDEGLALC